MTTFRLRLAPDSNDSYLVTSPDFPEVVSFGENQVDATAHGLDAIEEAIASRIAEKQTIPAPGLRDGVSVAVKLPPLTYLKSMLYQACRNQSVTRAVLQRRLGWSHRESIDRLFRLDHRTDTDSLVEALRAVGVDRLNGSSVWNTDTHQVFTGNPGKCVASRSSASG